LRGEDSHIVRTFPTDAVVWSEEVTKTAEAGSIEEVVRRGERLSLSRLAERGEAVWIGEAVRSEEPLSHNQLVPIVAIM
jgi:hypothetical protein